MFCCQGGFAAGELVGPGHSGGEIVGPSHSAGEIVGPGHSGEGRWGHLGVK